MSWTLRVKPGEYSVPACAIALATRLPSLGAILVVDRDPDDDEPVVRYASIRPDSDRGWPKVYPWPCQRVPAAHPLRSISEGAPVLRRTFWATPWGEMADYYLDAIAVSSRRAIAVLADADLWGAEKFHPPAAGSMTSAPSRRSLAVARRASSAATRARTAGRSGARTVASAGAIDRSRVCRA